MPKKITCTMWGCTDPAEVVLTYPDQEEEPDVICHRHAEWIFNTIAAERTCATCRHRRGIGGECFHPGGPMPIWAVRVEAFGCNRWEKREEVAPCKT